jgi:uncharacterized protein YwbE
MLQKLVDVVSIIIKTDQQPGTLSTFFISVILTNFNAKQAFGKKETY